MHRDIWRRDLLRFVDEHGDTFTIVDGMLSTNLGRPAVLQAIDDMRADGYEITVDVKGRVAITSHPDPRPSFTMTRNDLVCRHPQVTVDALERRITCTDCGRLRDPFDHLQMIAGQWDRIALERSQIMRRLEAERRELEGTLHDIKLAKARLKRAERSAMRSPAATRAPKKAAPPPESVRETLDRIRKKVVA